MNLNFFVSLDIAGPFQTNEEKYINLIKTKVKYLNENGHDINFIGIVDLKNFQCLDIKVFLYLVDSKGLLFYL